MKSYRFMAMGAAALVIASCCKTASIKGTVAQAPESPIVVKTLDSVLDTLSTDKSGSFSYKIELEEGQPEFVYLYRGEVRIASLILSAGEKVTVEADTLGNYTVEGSEESLKLQTVEQDYASLIEKMNSILSDSENGAEVNRELSKAYVEYYRHALQYVISNSKSFSVIPVLYQKINDDFPVFGQVTDALHFRAVCDSLKQVYPDSKYVKALEKETVRREGLMALDVKLNSSEALSYPELNLPDNKGQKVALSSLSSKACLLVFWTASEAAQKMFNVDVLKPLYEEFHSKGLEIYQVCADEDKATWASTIKNQELPWINVCDGKGLSSPALRLYNVTALPTMYLISGGVIVPDKISGEAALRNYIVKALK